jgi:DnaJ homolog subfamily C member 7
MTPEPEAEVDLIAQAEETKEKGNVAFKAKNFTEAVDLYTKAIGEYLSNPYIFDTYPTSMVQT